MILAIDPGPKESAWVLMEEKTLKPVELRKEANREVLAKLRYGIQKTKTKIVLEMPACYGMPVGEDVFETVYWVGKFHEAACGQFTMQKIERLKRMDVKMHICHDSRAKDSNIRQALMDRFGDKGTKKEPGWFHGFADDIWQAYALGVTFAES